MKSRHVREWIVGAVLGCALGWAIVHSVGCRSLSPEEIEAARQILCAAQPETCAPRPTPTEAPPPTTMERCWSACHDAHAAGLLTDADLLTCVNNCNSGVCPMLFRCRGQEPPDPPGCCLRLPTPAPTVATPTAGPTATMTPAPSTRPPVDLTPTAAPTSAPATPTPTPATPTCNAAPVPPDTPVSLVRMGGCPRGFEQAAIAGAPGPVCTARAGCSVCTAADGSTWVAKPARKVVEDIANASAGNFRQAPNGGWYVFDWSRGWWDAYARYFPDPDGSNGPVSLYVHPEGWTAPYSWGLAALPLTECPPTPTPAPTVGPTPPTAPGQCPPLHAVQWDVLRIALKSDRSTPDEDGDGRPDRDGSEARPAVADTDIIVGSITPKMTQPWCPGGRVICELTKECQDAAVGFPRVRQSLAGHFSNDPVVHNSTNAFITFMNLAPGETGRYEIEACTEAGTHCTTSFVWVR